MPSETTPPTQLEWQKLYAAASTIKRMAPWEWMSDEDLFAVINPENGESGYCAVMGAGGEVFGLSVHCGDAGLRHYLRLRNSTGKPLDDDMLRSLNALTLTFDNKTELETPDKQIIKALGLSFEGPQGWPRFRSYRPGYFPWFLNSTECRFLEACVTQTARIAQNLLQNPDYLTSPGENKILMCQQNRSRAAEWEEVWAPPKLMKRIFRAQIQNDQDFLKIIASLPSQTNTAWEVDYFYAPAYIQGNKTQRPYFPVTIMFSDAQSYFVLNVHISEPAQWGGNLHHQLLVTIQKAGFLPQTIRVRKEDVFAYLEPLLVELKITLELEKKLPAIDDAKAGMKNFLSNVKP
ncbi:MAG: hypothetical protein A2Y02_01150 [Omnitrophica bacterium GWA2_52_12]|nr:MAG: hypothetical protein A2Y02_01150 [Omnitrophica bacterium GWA2_52_12]